jgi:hypothetical protein
MPIEIKELVLRAVVDTASDRKASPPPAAADEREALVQACVAQTLKALRARRER